MKIKIAATFLLLIALILLVLDCCYPPNLTKLNDQASVVSDRNGRPLRAFANSNGVWRYPVTVEKVSAHYLEALFNYEDRYFYYHPGVNPFSMLRAVGQAIYYGRAISGGSTITMQVARLLHPNKRSISGKIYQMLRAFQLEWRFSKTNILNIYLNIAPFGGPIEGVEAASYVYFDKPALELTPNESALLAVLPQSPSRFRPDRHPVRALNARNKLLRRLATFKVWDSDLIATLIKDPIYADYFPHPKLAPILARRLRKQQPSAHIKTFIDGDLQEQLENQVRSYVKTLGQHTSAAVMVMHGKTGEVVAYLGSANFDNNARAGHVDMINAVRSPGSTLKPFVYGAAIEQGLIHENSLLQDVPIIKGHYRPTNFSGGFSGPVAVKDALLRSLNLPVLQILNNSSVIALAARLSNGGLDLHWPQGASANQALILGGVGVKLEQLVSAYSALINQGHSVTPRYQPSSPHQKQFMLEPGVAWIIQNILRQQKIPGRISSQLSANGGKLKHIGWKTGTSYGFRDAWVIGFSGPYIIGVWTGRADAQPVSHNSGSVNALPLFLQVAAHFDQDYQPPMPASVTLATTCWPGGLNKQQTSDSNCLQQQQSWLYQQLAPPTLAIAADQPQPLNVNFWQEPDGSRATLLCASVQATTASINLWPPALSSWLKPAWQHSGLLPPLSAQCKSESVQTQQSLIITSIKPNSHFIRRHDQALTLSFKTNESSQSIYWFLNGKLLNNNHHNFTQAGRFQLLALDNQGRVDSVNFVVE
ncbi:MAG: penicillin-binding protein 1C [Gammaproteobacteria bacterium]|nr:penicillin-binding protein 1C [Gammaproteobacteria bacterium]